MWNISKKEYDKRLKKIKEHNLSKERAMKLKEERKKYSKKREKPSTSKVVLFVILMICLEIIIFSQYLMIRLQDASSLYVLIGIAATMVTVIWKYYSKSQAENTAGGIVYETAMRENIISEVVLEPKDDETAVG